MGKNIEEEKGGFLNQRKNVLLPLVFPILFAVSPILIGALVFLLPTLFSISPSPDTDGSIRYYGYVCTQVHRFVGYSDSGEALYVTEPQECGKNLIYNNGLNLTRDILRGIFNTSHILNISVGNASTAVGPPVAGATESYTAYAGCGMLSVEGSHAVVPTSGGNWSVYNTFTSSCDNVITNVSRLTNRTGGVFAGNTFTLANLSNNDQLTINWSLSLS